MSLGQLRQAILAVVVGNLLFSDVEQLQFNHQTFDCETAEQLGQLLHQVGELAAQRDLLAETQCLAASYSPFAEKDRQWADVKCLLEYPGLDWQVKECMPGIFNRSTEVRRLDVVGTVYCMVLSRLNRLEVPRFALN